MGSSISQILAEKHFVKPKYITLSDRDVTSISELSAKNHISVTGNNVKAVRGADILLLAVKPIDMNGVLHEISAHLSKNTLVISIAAGITIRHIQTIIGTHITVIRAMPNTPTRIAKGVTVWTSAKVSPTQKRYAQRLFRMLGDEYHTDDEALLDKVTAVSGSGPAYFFYFTECFVRAARALGMDEQLAYLLATKTFTGTALFLEQTGKTPEELRRAVTSKNGTTEAGIRAMEHKLDTILALCVRAAYIRAMELGNQKKSV